MLFAAVLDLGGMTLLLPPVLALVDPAALSYFPSWLQALGPLQMALYFTGLFLVKNIIVIYIHRYSTRFAFAQADRLSGTMLAYLHRLPPLERRSLKTTDMVYRVAVVSSQFSQYYFIGVLQAFSETCILVTGFIILMVWQPLVTLLVVVTLFPVAALLYRYLRKRQKTLTLHNRELLPDAYREINQVLGASQQIHTAGTYSTFARQHLDIQSAYHRNQAGITLTSSLLPRSMEMLAALSILLLVALAAMQVAGRAELAFTVVLYATFALRILPSLNRFISVLVQVRSYRYTADILLPAVNNAPVVAEDISSSREISLQHVSFYFPGEQKAFLEDISLHIPCGSCIGLYGRSGSGKSTLLHIIGGWYPVSEGVVTVDGIPLTAENTGSWQRHTAWVQQDIYLVDGSLKANIALGAEIDESRMLALVDMLGMNDWINSLPQGLDTPSGELGNRLSGGQQQLIRHCPCVVP